jgi:hypothetical protein
MVEVKMSPRNTTLVQRLSRSFPHFVLMLAFAGGAMAAQPGNLRAGAGRVDVTPTPDVFPYSDAYQKPPFVGVHDPVFARALMLDDGSTQVAIVVVDATTIPSPKVLNHDVAEAAGIPESNLLIAASHTHSSLMVYYQADLPVLVGERKPDAAQLKEVERIRKGAVDAVRQAKASLRPARLAFGRGQAYLNGYNGGAAPAGGRRELGAFGFPRGPSDKSLDVLRVDGTDGTPIALLLNYAHPGTVMLHAPSRDGMAEVSGDLLGVTAQFLEKSSPKAPVVLFASGADGDQGSIFRWSTPRVGDLPAQNQGQAAWAILNVMAGYLASATLAVTDSMPEGTSTVKLSAAAKTVVCPGQKVRWDAKTDKATISDLPPVPIALNVIRINDIVLDGVAGNVPTELGAKIKATSSSRNTTLIGNTSGTVGYILPDSAYEHPGHDLAGDPLKKGCAWPAIVGGFSELMGGKK